MEEWKPADYISLARIRQLCHSSGMKVIATILSLTLTAPLHAQDAMTAEEFDAYTRGQTFYYSQNGQPYGAERYLENRRVEWAFQDGICKHGSWYQENDQICFVYEDMPDPQCWHFRLGEHGLIARFGNDPEATELYEARKTTDRLDCSGPQVGA